jgi:hypothetical protein
MGLSSTCTAENIIVQNKHSVKQKSHIVVGSGATIHISKNTTLITASNISMQGNISGEGKLILKSDRRISIDANKHEISNLVIENPKGVELVSALQIANGLVLAEGKLFLNDFNITLTNRFAFIDISKEAAIIFNGSGIVIESTDLPITQKQDKNPKISPNQFKFVQREFHKVTEINESYSCHLHPESPLTGVIPTLDPPPRLS